jgi:hypothetical protein
MVVLLEFVCLEIGNKKGPETRAWSDRYTHSQDASGQPNPSPEAGPRIRALALEYVMTFTVSCLLSSFYQANLPKSRHFVPMIARRQPKAIRRTIRVRYTLH